MNLFKFKLLNYITVNEKIDLDKTETFETY